MKVFKMDDRLAVRLPKAVVDELGLKEGDDVSVLPLAKDAVTVQKAATRAEFLMQMGSFVSPSPRATSSTVTRPMSGERVLDAIHGMISSRKAIQ